MLFANLILIALILALILGLCIVEHYDIQRWTAATARNRDRWLRRQIHPDAPYASL
jgi:hypothetical protein